MTTKAESAIDPYTFGTHGDLPALLDRHHTAIAVAPRPMAIREFKDTMYDLLEAMENAVEGNTMDLMEMATEEGREEIRDELGDWKAGAMAEVEALEKALSGEGREGVPNYPVALNAFIKLKRMIERVQELLLTRLGAAA